MTALTFVLVLVACLTECRQSGHDCVQTSVDCQTS